MIPCLRSILRVPMAVAGTGTEKTPWPLAAGDEEADLPRAGGHDPEMAGEVLRVRDGSLHRVGDRRVLRCFAGEQHRRDRDVVDAGSLRADLDLGDAGDDERRSNDDRTTCMGQRSPST